MPVRFTFHSSKGIGPHEDHVFHKGDDIEPFRAKLRAQLSSLKEITADGDELLWMRFDFPTIPFATHRTENVWEGDIAKFILRNF